MYYAKIPFRSPCAEKKPFTSARGDAYVGTETTRTGPFILQKEGIKTAEQQSLIVLT